MSFRPSGARRGSSIAWLPATRGSRAARALRRRLEGMAVDQLERQRPGHPLGPGPQRGMQPSRQRGVRRPAWRPGSTRCHPGRAVRPAAPRVGPGEGQRSWSITGSAKPACTSMSPRSCMSTRGAIGSGQPCWRMERRAAPADCPGPAWKTSGTRRRPAPAAIAIEHGLRVGAAMQMHVGPQQLGAAGRHVGLSPPLRAPDQRRADHQGLCQRATCRSRLVTSGSQRH
jgi:hypothetical protein